ncbi:hypothetical protein Bca52824_082081 [Brassica carinata]|uniref:Uncharacterized protein n=1 Tax=Brassica carinata TaxID=52824 RepID=A0A8X7PIH6_BRACI|nr:hypothetical protein Bca52824_082081 [Brassica carinata]
MLKGVEERIVKSMEEGFSGINLTVETKLEAMNWTMGKLEKNQRVLKKKAKKIEDMLTSIESKGNEDEEYRQWNDFNYDVDEEEEKAEESDKNPDVDQDMEEEEKKAEESEDNPVESPSEKQTELAEKSVEKKGRPKKTDVTLKQCTPLPEKRKSEPPRWVQSPFTEGKTDELEVPKKKLKAKT